MLTKTSSLPPCCDCSGDNSCLSQQYSFILILLQLYLRTSNLSMERPWEGWTGLHEMAMAAYESQYIDIEVQSSFLDDQLNSLSPPRKCMPPDSWINRTFGKSFGYQEVGEFIVPPLDLHESNNGLLRCKTLSDVWSNESIGWLTYTSYLRGPLRMLPKTSICLSCKDKHFLTLGNEDLNVFFKCPLLDIMKQDRTDEISRHMEAIHQEGWTGLHEMAMAAYESEYIELGSIETFGNPLDTRSLESSSYQPLGCWFGGKPIQKLRQKGVYEESFSRHAAWIGGKLIQLMHTTMVQEQVKTMKIQAGIQVLRRGELRRQLQLWKRFGRLYYVVICTC
ncbi:hypothetical protein Tco_0563256 [Tanacetum coccineum]